MRSETGRTRGFTLIELLVVMTIILILASLILATSGYVQKKSYRSRAAAEIAAMSSALENYKADNGVYPGANQTPAAASASDLLDARTAKDPSIYASASLLLYNALAGATGGSRVSTGTKSYFAFKPNMLLPSDQTLPVSAIRDPFGNSYGYSTANQRDSTTGYNLTFDLWSTGGTTGTDPNDPNQWIKSW